MSSALERTLGLSELARSWAERLRGAELEGKDALVVVGGPPALLGRHFPLERGAGRIVVRRGEAQPSRLPGDPITLDSGYISDPHATLEAVPEGWLLVDQQSSNHTYVGTVRIDRQRLVYGDEVRLGDVVLLFISAELERLPSHVIDPASGLLAARVFEAEAGRLPAGAELALLLLRCPGLREQLATVPAPAAIEALPGRIGAALLVELPGAVLGRLQVDLFAAAWQGGQALSTAGAARAAIERLCAAAGLPPPRGSLGRASGPRVPQLLAAGLATLEEPGAPLLSEAELAEQRLLLDAELLAALIARPELTLLLLSLADEDSLRHRLGNDRLLACRWRLRRLAGLAQGAGLAGLLDQRVLVLGFIDAEAAARAGGELRQSFASAAPELAGERLAASLIAPEERQHRRGRDVRRLLLEVVDGPAPAGTEWLEVDGLPGPIAAPCALIRAASSETGRLRAVLQAAEMATRYAACCALAALARWGPEEARLRLQPTLARLGRRSLSLGDWVALLRQLAPEVQALEQPVACQLAAALSGEASLATQLERQLLPARNAFAHGGATSSEEGGASQVRRLLPELRAVLQALSPLQGTPLIAVVETRPRRGGGARASVRLLAGARENFEVRQVELRCAEPLFPGSVYLCSDDYRQALELQPLVRLQPCPRCDRDEMFLAEGLSPPGARLELRAVSTGHPLSFRPALEDLPEGWLRLLGSG